MNDFFEAYFHNGLFRLSTQSVHNAFYRNYEVIHKKFENQSSTINIYSSFTIKPSLSGVIILINGNKIEPKDYIIRRKLNK